MSEKEKEQEQVENQNSGNMATDPSRRSFLKVTGAVIGGAIVGGLVTSAFGKKGTSQAPMQMEHTAPRQYDQAMMFFTDQEDFNTIEAASERIYPKTEEGPGAKELGVGYYIDHQLVGAWGNNTKEYHQAPFFENEAVPEQGYQTRLKRNEVFVLGIQLLREEAQKRSKKEFKDLTGEEQDAILKDIETDKLQLKGIAKASYFFKLLLQATLEGAYADPMYGGNKDMMGWKMKKFPGANTDEFAKVVDKVDFVKLEPMSLKDHMGH